VGVIPFGQIAIFSVNQLAKQQFLMTGATALEQYARIEATALWRPCSDAMHREVVISLGEATLKICDLNDRVLAHWSLAAVRRANPGRAPAVFHPAGDLGEQLELAATETEMIDAITHIQSEILARKVGPGKLRWWVAAIVAVAVVGASMLWLSDGLRRYALRVLPDSQRVEIGQTLLARMHPTLGAACTNHSGQKSLDKMAKRLGVRRLLVVPSGVTAVHFPGGIVVLNRALVENYDDPSVPAGFALAEQQRAQLFDPVDQILQTQGIMATASLLSTGRLPPAVLDSYAETLLAQTPNQPRNDLLIARFKEVGLPVTPYALALDIAGNETQTLIENDPIPSGSAYDPALQDGDWVQLQNICQD
jgi:hypothetical protein